MEDKIQSIERAFKILEVIVSSVDSPLSLSEIARHVDLKITTTYSILDTLLKLGYISKDENTKKYKTGEKFLNLFFFPTRKYILLRYSEPVMKQLSERIKESVVLGIFYKGERYTIAKVEYKEHIISVNLDVFIHAGCYETATGRILLSYSDEKIVKEYVRRHGYPGEKWNDINNFEDLKKAMERIRKDKIAIVEGEAVALGVPVFGPNKEIWASLGVFLPLVRFKRNRRKIIDELKKSGRELSLKIGGEDG